tara:strand:- start:5 stop:220 length:216 start_codon:yes stop_codon:yes gene_type:complete
MAAPVVPKHSRSAGKIFPFALVPLVFRLRDDTQVINPVIVSAVVDVVNMTFGPFPVVHRPYHAMGVIKASI